MRNAGRSRRGFFFKQGGGSTDCKAVLSHIFGLSDLFLTLLGGFMFDTWDVWSRYWKRGALVSHFWLCPGDSWARWSSSSATAVSGHRYLCPQYQDCLYFPAVVGDSYNFPVILLIRIQFCRARCFSCCFSSLCVVHKWILLRKKITLDRQLVHCSDWTAPDFFSSSS